MVGQLWKQTSYARPTIRQLWKQTSTTDLYGMIWKQTTSNQKTQQADETCLKIEIHTFYSSHSDGKRAGGGGREERGSF